MIRRTRHVKEIQRRLNLFPVVGIIGARQVGKTTLATQIRESTAGPSTHFDLEKPSDLARLSEPQLALEPLKGLVILDEIQRVPDLFPLLRVLADRPDTPARFLVLGSASPNLLKQSSESLAGRVSFYELPGFGIEEIGQAASDELWIRGGFPRAMLAPNDEASNLWRQEFIRTYLERDLPTLGINLQTGLLQRFWTMLAHSHGQIWNSSRIGAALGVAHTTVRSHLDVLRDTFMVRLLPPYLSNTGKRQVKSPKVYFRDTGVLHSLLGIGDLAALTGHPIVGASWEGFAMEHVIRSIGANPRRCFFWALHTGAEIDLVIEDGPRLLGFQFKRTLSPKLTPAIRSACEALALSEVTVVYPGREEYPLSDAVHVRPLRSFA